MEATVQKIYSHYEASLRRIKAELEEVMIHSQIRADFSPDFYSPMSEREIERDRKKLITKAARENASFILGAASRAFAVNGTRLDLGKEVLPAEVYNPEELESYSPQSLWAYLSERYGGGKASGHLFQDAAQKLAKVLNLQRVAPQTRSGKLCIEISVQTDNFAKKWHDVNRLDAGSATKIADVMDGLSVFAEWQGEQSLKENALCEKRYWRDKAEIISREVRSLSEGVEMVTTGRSFTLRFSMAQGEKFRLFIAEFAGENRAAA